MYLENRILKISRIILTGGSLKRQTMVKIHSRHPRCYTARCNQTNVIQQLVFYNEQPKTRGATLCTLEEPELPAQANRIG